MEEITFANTNNVDDGGGICERADMRSVTDIIDAFGGNSKFAAVIGKGASTASEMRRRKSIPVDYWPRLIEASAKWREHAPLSYEELVAASVREAA